MRFDDSPDLFGRGVGQSTSGDFTCEMCCRVYNEGADAKEEYGSESVGHTEFAGLEVCEECFERIENAVLARMGDILPWYAKILTEWRGRLEKHEDALKNVAGK